MKEHIPLIVVWCVTFLVIFWSISVYFNHLTNLDPPFSQHVTIIVDEEYNNRNYKIRLTYTGLLGDDLTFVNIQSGALYANNFSISASPNTEFNLGGINYRVIATDRNYVILFINAPPLPEGPEIYLVSIILFFVLGLAALSTNWEKILPKISLLSRKPSDF